MESTGLKKNAGWVASLYFFQSIPFVVVSLIATLMYQQYGMNNAQAALITSCLMVPWTIKPLFAPTLEHFPNKKRVILFAQVLMAFLFIVLAFNTPNPHFLWISFIGFALLALISSIHDIVSDGLYLLALNERAQKKYVAWRSFFYQMGRLVIKGGILVVIGQLAFTEIEKTWQFFFISLSIMAVILILHHWVCLPQCINSKMLDANYLDIFKSLLLHSKTPGLLVFIFLYNFADAQMQRIIPLFLVDPQGLHLNLRQIGELYGIAGGVALMMGIFVSGFFLSRYRIERCVLRFTIPLMLGHAFFLLLSLYALPGYFLYCIIPLNQFALGLANGAYMGLLLSIANKSEYPMSMYTVCTSIMALSYVVFGAFSGWVQQQLNYSGFFLYIALANSLLLLITYRVMKNGL